MKLRIVTILAGLIANTAFADDKQKEEPKPEKTEVAYKSTTHGAIQVNGTTGDWFTIYQGKKDVGPGVPPKVGGTAEILPGEYDVYVNKTKRTVTVKAGMKVVLETGTLVVEGKGADWWTPHVGKERMIVSNPPILGAALSLFPGKYTVRVHKFGTDDVELTDAAKVEPGKKTVLTYKK